MSTTPIDMGDGSPDARKQMRAEDVRALWKEYRQQDPALGKRENILKAYYRHPHVVKNLDDCLLERPANANYGMLAMAVDRQKKIFLDMVRSSVSAFRITVKDRVKVKGRGSKSDWSERITGAFQKFCIRRWTRWDYNMQIVILNMLLYSRGPIWWRDNTTIDARALGTGRLFAPADAGHLPDEWDSCCVEWNMTYAELWDKIDVEGWDSDQIKELCKAGSASAGEKDAEKAIQEWESGTGKSIIAGKRSRDLVWFYQRNNSGSIDMYIIPEEAPGVETAPLYYRRGAIKKMSNVVALIVENPALGSFYKTPSFAESIYVSSMVFDDRTNKAGDAAALNMMLMLQGGDEATFRRQGKIKLRDRIWFPPGTTPAQVKFVLPVQESMDFARSIHQMTMNQSGVAQIGGTNDAGAKTPKSATQSWFDGKTSEAMQSSDLKAFASGLTPFGKELYARFVSLTSADNAEMHEAKTEFVEYLEARGIPEAAWQPKNVEIECRLNLAAGSPATKMQNSMATFDVLAKRPSSRGEKLAQRNALVAINGEDALDDYDAEDANPITTPEDRLIGHENEQMRDAGAKIENLPPMADDDHLRHLFGREVGGMVPGHLNDAWETILEARQLLSVQADPSDAGMHLDKVSAVIGEMKIKLTHASAHVAFLSTDTGKQQYVEKATQLIEQMFKITDGITKAFQQMQQKRAEAIAGQREEAAQQQAGGQQDPAKQQELAHKAQAADIELSNKLMKGDVERREKIKDAELDRQLKLQEVQDDRAAEMVKAASKAKQTGPKEPKEPSQPKSGK